MLLHNWLKVLRLRLGFDSRNARRSVSRRRSSQLPGWRALGDASTERLEDRTLLSSITVTTTADEDDGVLDSGTGAGTSLREAINYSASGDTIELAADATYVLSLGAGGSDEANGGGNDGSVQDLDINHALTINGNGATIDGGSGESFEDRVIHIHGVEATINDVTITSGYSNAGSGILADNGAGAVLNLNRSTVNGNTSTGTGGGILLSSSTVAVIDQSTISSNSAAMGGGGIYANASTSLTVTNSTISGNPGFAGTGGIFSFSTTTLTHVTIANNSTAGSSFSAGVAGNVNASFILITGNTGGTGNVSGTLTGSNNYNADDSGDLTAAQLGPLADNGGPTLTHALLGPAATNPAINSGADSGITVDQRNSTRDSSSDIGAFEFPSVDYGDAPDTAAGSGTGNYETTLANGGPSHTVVAGLFLGDTVDGSEDGSLQNARANADDVDGSLPDDEDGVLSPQTDLLGTIGAAPTVTLLATNTTGNAATLYGWIDYNQDGVFDNSTERTSVAVPDSTTDGRFTLTFPTIPNGSTGSTYARFRLSTDGAAANSTGSATDGEVEDYQFAITAPVGQPVTVGSLAKIAHQLGGGPSLVDGNLFGSSVVVLGDLDGDGVPELAVGARSDDTGGTDRGAVHILFMNADGTVKSSTKIADGSGGLAADTLADDDRFGAGVAVAGDLNGDGVPDLAVTAQIGATGVIHFLLLNADGSVLSATINSDVPTSGSVAGIGDLNGDGVPDIAVGDTKDGTGGFQSGAVHILFLNSDGTTLSTTKIASGVGGGPTLGGNKDYFGTSVAAVGDLDGDGITDLAVGARGTPIGAEDDGSLYILLMNSDGTARESVQITNGTNGGPALADGDAFGTSVAAVGDLDGDGLPDLVVGSNDAAGVYNRGAAHVLLMNSDGTARSTSKLASGTNGGPSLMNADLFGASITSLGDLDGDGVTDLAVGAIGDDTGGSYRGAVHILYLASPDTTPPTVTVNIVDASLNDGDNASSVTFEFSEAVSSFAADDVSVNGGTLSNFAGSGASYSATFTADDGVETTGSVTIGTAYTDAAGNSGTAGSDNVTVDRIEPVPVITGPGSPTGSDPFDVTIDFGESVTEFVSGGITVGNGSVTNLVDNGGGTFTATINATSDGVVTVDVAGGVATDAGGNVNTAAAQFSLTVDTTVPVVDVVDVSGDPRTTAVDEVSIVFSEAVSGFGIEDLSLTVDTGSGAGSNLLTGSQTLVTSDNVTFVLGNLSSLTGAVGDYVLTVNASGSGIVDAAGNALTADASDAWSRVNPTVTLSIDEASIAEGGGTTTGQATITATLSQATDVPVTVSLGFTGSATNVDDYSVSGSTIVINAGGSSGSITLTAVSDGLLEGNENAFVDIIGVTNGEESATQQVSTTIVDDDVAPVFTSTATPEVPENLTSVLTVVATDADVPTQTVTYSISGGADASLFDISSGGALTFRSAPDFENPGDDGANNFYDVQVTADDGNGGVTTQNISVRVTDVDEVAPTVSVTAVAPDPRNVAVGSIEIVFSEAIVGFDIGDLSLTRDTGSGPGANLLTGSESLSSSDGGVTFSLGNLSSLTTADGTYVLTLTASGSGIADAASNALSGDTADDWTMDATAPTATISEVTPDPRNTPVPSLTIVFTEAVVGFDIGDLSLTRDTGSGPSTNLLTGLQTLTTSDNITFTLNNTSSLTGPR
ncbi:MAG: FG-GAP repeat protein [Rhodopirellula sp.]|nr:FG-GAP repeat protein [Rhodopirellula sp.]